MASLTISIQDQETSKLLPVAAKTFARIQNGQVFPRTGVIHPTGIIPVPRAAVAGTTLFRSARDTASDIGGYRKLTSAIRGLFLTRTATFTGTPIPTGEQAIEEYATDAGDMDGVVSNASTREFGIRAQKDVGGGTEECYVRMEVYHRTTGGTETLLASWTTPNLTDATWVDYTEDLTITQSWGTNERLVAKLVARNDGVPT